MDSCTASAYSRTIFPEGSTYFLFTSHTCSDSVFGPKGLQIYHDAPKLLIETKTCCHFIALIPFWTYPNPLIPPPPSHDPLSQNCIVPGEAQLTALMKTLPTLLNLYICLVIRNGRTGELIQLTPGQGPSKEVHPTAHYHIWSWKAGAEHLYLTLFIIPRYQIMFVKPDE